MARVLVALSGGVDSAAAAALLRADGHDVTAVHLKLADVPVDAAGQGCCSFDDAQDARRVAQVLDLPFYVWDLSEVFRREVEEGFVAGYAGGTTPNPCIACNERVKYAALLDRARRLGFDYLATGHHARVRHDPDRPRLLRGRDRAKDQSYVLYRATAEQLRHTLLPVGELTKAEVRAVAAEHGLRVATKPDSVGVCFIPRGDVAGYLSRRLGADPGPIVDLDGRVLGHHQGAWRYTIGQRRGLGLGDHVRRFVVAVDTTRNTVVVGPREALEQHTLQLTALHWIGGAPPDGPVEVQVRAHAAPVPGRLVDDRLELDQPVWGVAPGQAAVVYRGEECLGGGVVARTAAVIADHR